MTLIRWEPIRELSALSSDLNRLFTSAFDTPTTFRNGDAVRRWVPAMDLLETDDRFVLRADLPGMTQDDVSIELQDGTLTVSGERKAAHEEQSQGWMRVERAFGTFSRSLSLPEGTDPDAVTASFENGVLEVQIPKPEKRMPRKIAIDVGGREAPSDKQLAS